MEKLVLRANSGNKYFNYELAPQPSGKTLLEKFLTTDLPTFKVTDNPRTHLISFIGIMALKGDETSLYACTFPLSLDLLDHGFITSMQNKLPLGVTL